MLAHVHTGALHGVEAYGVRVEVNLATGLPAFCVVGLAQGSVREGRERVAAALRNSGFGLPNRRITVNLAPADRRKEGTAFDLPIAVGILVASGHVPERALRTTVLLGELGLDGTLRPVPGVLPVALWARDSGYGRIVVPRENRSEAAIVPGLQVVGADALESVAALLRGERESHGVAPRGEASTSATVPPIAAGGPAGPELDLAEVLGQETAKRALQIAAAGDHNLLLVGPPGAGKTMLARRLPGLLPPLELRERIAVARIHSVAGLLVDGEVPRARPFRAPHHSVSYAGLAGGGSPPRPGEISLAHHGVLFLDELPEYRRNVLELLRQPIEEGSIVISRSAGSVRFPARFLLVAAMNPCPCGYHGDGSDRCLCHPAAVERYRSRVSGPLLDRIDLRVEVPPLDPGELARARLGPSSEQIGRTVSEARARQTTRYRDRVGGLTNGTMTRADLARWCPPDRAAAKLLGRAVERGRLSARGYDRVRRVARTLADLEGAEAIGADHVAEALQFRGGVPGR